MVTFTRSSRSDLVRPDATGPAGSAGPGKPADRRALVVLMAVILGLGLGGLAYVYLRGGDVVTTDTGAAAMARSATTAPGRTGGAASATSGPASTGATTRAAAPTGRNPFGPAAAVTGAGGATGSSGAAGTNGTPATGATAATGTGASPGGGAAATATVTVTQAVSAAYLGLYSWTGDGRPVFRLNTTASIPSVGGAIAPNLIYKGSFTSKSLKCATISNGGVAMSLCEGEVVALD